MTAEYDIIKPSRKLIREGLLYINEYLFAFFAISEIDNINAKTSATGSASHTPFTPIKIGKTSIAIHSTINVRLIEITAEILPLLRAVKRPDAKILIPQKR